MIDPTNSYPTIPSIDPVSRTPGFTESGPGEAMPTMPTAQQQQASSNSGLRTCGHITITIGRYSFGAIVGLTLAGASVIIVPVGYLLVGASTACIHCDDDDDIYTEWLPDRFVAKYIDVAKFCFKGFKSGYEWK